MKKYLFALLLVFSVSQDTSANPTMMSVVGALATLPDPCSAPSPALGTICKSGTIWLGKLPTSINPIPDKYMIMPSGCDGTTNNPNCSGNDTATIDRTWNDGTTNYGASGVEVFTTESQKSTVLGDTNTATLAAATVPVSGGAYAAAKYCKDMNFGGYTDWYLPSKSELAYIYCKTQGTTPNASYPDEDPNCASYGRESLLSGFATSSDYWSSTESTTLYAWTQNFNSGYQYFISNKNGSNRVRCIRREPCPENYIFVPKLAGYTTENFCVAKYEMKDVGGIATSQAAGNPWVSIQRGALATTASSAWKACKDLGTGYDLISNAQWQTIARNIETVKGNWSSGTVGTGNLARGWSASTSYGDTYTNTAVAPSTDAACLYNTAANTCGATGTHLYRRTHTLTNGKEIWDFSGNVWEWTRDNYADLGVNPAISADWQELSGLSAINKSLFSSADGTRNSAQGIGQAYGSSTGAVRRGGGWSDGAASGVFAVRLNGAPSATYTGLGFRCVFVP